MLEYTVHTCTYLVDKVSELFCLPKCSVKNFHKKAHFAIYSAVFQGHGLYLEQYFCDWKHLFFSYTLYYSQML